MTMIHSALIEIRPTKGRLDEFKGNAGAYTTVFYVAGVHSDMNEFLSGVCEELCLELVSVHEVGIVCDQLSEGHIDQIRRVGYLMGTWHLFPE